MYTSMLIEKNLSSFCFNSIVFKRVAKDIHKLSLYFCFYSCKLQTITNIFS